MKTPLSKNMKYSLGALIAAVLIFAGISLAKTATPSPQPDSTPMMVEGIMGSGTRSEPSFVPTPDPIPVTTANPGSIRQASDPTDSTYVNVDGITVPDPTFTTDNAIPSGATAQCRDGSYSFSQHRSGTCSDHGGVQQWL